VKRLVVVMLAATLVSSCGTRDLGETQTPAVPTTEVTTTLMPIATKDPEPVDPTTSSLESPDPAQERGPQGSPGEAIDITERITIVVTDPEQP